MKKETIQIKLPRRKTRAIEFYAHGTPYKSKSVKLKTAYTRKAKHQRSADLD